MTEIYIYIYIYEHEAIRRPKSENNIRAPSAPQKWLTYVRCMIYSTSQARSVMTLTGPSQILQLFMSLAGFLGRQRRPYIVFRFRYSYGFMFVYIYISVILQMAALMSIFTKLKIISNVVSPYLNRTKCVQEDVLIE